MPSWQNLYELLVNEDMTAHDIRVALGVRPARLRRMLLSKRLAARLEVIEAVADKKAGHALVASIAPAMHRMTELIGADRPETSRRACLDLLEAALKIFRSERIQRNRE